MQQNYVEYNSPKDFNFLHIIDQADYSVDFHCHDFYEIYLSVSGGKNFLINDKIYDINPKDLFINNNYEIHKTTTIEGVPYERYVLEFKPEFVLPFCTRDTNLIHYFYKRPSDFSNKISLTDEQYEKLLGMFQQYEKIPEDQYGKDVLQRLYFIEILVFVADLFRNRSSHSAVTSAEYENVITPLLEYISHNLSDNLSLDRLAKEVNISKHHMCKLFKKCTGTTINKFIVTKRIAAAKELFGQEKTATDVCAAVGFNDYCHFIRTFTKIVGISPARYAKQAITHEPSEIKKEGTE